MAEGRHIANPFWHNSAADCPISVKFCTKKYGDRGHVT